MLVNNSYYTSFIQLYRIVFTKTSLRVIFLNICNGVNLIFILSALSGKAELFKKYEYATHAHYIMNLGYVLSIFACRMFNVCGLSCMMMVLLRSQYTV